MKVGYFPSRKNTVGCHWVFTMKYHPHMPVGHWLPKDTQIYCVNYVDAISHVAKIGFVWLLVSLPPNLGLPLFQLHVKNALLHGDLQEEV